MSRSLLHGAGGFEKRHGNTGWRQHRESSEAEAVGMERNRIRKRGAAWLPFYSTSALCLMFSLKLMTLWSYSVSIRAEWIMKSALALLMAMGMS